MEAGHFDLQPNLSGKLLGLRPLEEGDFDILSQVASDPLIWEQHPQANRHQRDVFKSFFEEALKSKGALLAMDSKTGEVIGSSRYYDYAPQKNEVAIGYPFSAVCAGEALTIKI